MSIWRRKPLSQLLEEASDTEKGLKKTLTAPGLIALGVGVVVGAGLFSVTGLAAATNAGPSITISFLIAAIGCVFAGLCYAEFASMIPVAGSAYTYSFATMGEFIAWIIGWDLVLEYAVGAATVSISWSRYLTKFLDSYGVHLDKAYTHSPFEGGVINIPAVLVVMVMSLILIKGTRESSFVNGVIVIIKVSVVLVFIALGWEFVKPENLIPYVPENTGTFGEFGFTGIIRAAAIVFFAYVGFDAVSTAAQETKNPKRDMPIGILMSLVICTVLYVLFAHVLTGVVNYTAFEGADGIAPVAIAIESMGYADASGVIVPAYPWLNKAIIIAILLGYCSVIMVLLMGQSRVFFSMSKDGLLPKVFSEIHSKFRTPAKNNLLFMLLVSLFAAFVPARVVGEMTSIGTLFAFILVCLGVLIMRKKMPDAPRAFRTPLVPLVPVLGVLVCLFMMIFLPLDTWIRLIVWMMIGFDLYLFYGMKHSKLNNGDFKKNSYKTVAVSGIAMVVALIVVAVIHHATPEIDDNFLYYFSLIFSALHAVIYSVSFFKNK